MEVLHQSITPRVIESAYDYQSYRQLIHDLLAEQKTTNDNHSDSYLEYTRLNNRRMDRWEKTAKVSSHLQELVTQIKMPQIWLVITEGWCGDASQSIPFIQKVADLNPLIQVRYILRDQNPEIMDQYLTNGARSIPMLVAFTRDLSKQLFKWGPRPAYLQERLKQYKIDPKGESPAAFAEGTHLWYARDKNRSLDQELIQLIAQQIQP
ncbi:thioredoxin family protein [Algoriphagus namhaensis]